MNRSSSPGRAWPAVPLPIAGIVLCVVLAIAQGCTRTPPEQALRDEISALQAAIENRDAGAVEDVLAADFIGNDGLDRKGARRLAAVMFLRNAAIVVRVGPLDIAMQDDHATVRGTVVVTGGSGGLLPESGRIYDLESGWRLEDGEWRMSSAHWHGNP